MAATGCKHHVGSELSEVGQQLQCMPAVNPGFGGQKFIEYQVEKVRKLRQMCDDAGVNPWIEIDGGISGKNAYKACLSCFCSTKSVMGHVHPKSVFTCPKTMCFFHAPL